MHFSAITSSFFAFFFLFYQKAAWRTRRQAAFSFGDLSKIKEFDLYAGVGRKRELSIHDLLARKSIAVLLVNAQDLYVTRLEAE